MFFLEIMKCVDDTSRSVPNTALRAVVECVKSKLTCRRNGIPGIVATYRVQVERYKASRVYNLSIIYPIRRLPPCLHADVNLVSTQITLLVIFF